MKSTLPGAVESVPGIGNLLSGEGNRRQQQQPQQQQQQQQPRLPIQIPIPNIFGR